MTWHECSQHVLGVEGSVYKKYNDYDRAVRDFTASCQALTAPPQLLQNDTYPALPDLDPDILHLPLCCYNLILVLHTMMFMVRLVLGKTWPLSLF
jgi:hypothetical protein